MNLAAVITTTQVVSVAALCFALGRTLGVVLNMVPQRRARGYGYGYAPEQGRHGQAKPNTEEKSGESALEKIGLKRS